MNLDRFAYLEAEGGDPTSLQYSTKYRSSLWARHLAYRGRKRVYERPYRHFRDHFKACSAVSSTTIANGHDTRLIMVQDTDIERLGSTH